MRGALPKELQAVGNMTGLVAGRSLVYASALMVALLCGCGPATPARHPDREGARVLEAALSTYGGLKTYEDSGVVVTTYWHEDSPRIHGALISFETAFARPSSFRFVYNNAANTDDQTHGFVVSTSAGVWSRSDGKQKIEQARSGDAAVTSLAGVTEGSVAIVWDLLARRNPWKCEEEMPATVAAIGREVIAGKRCLRLRVEHPRCDPVDLWLDESTHLVRKVLERGHLPGTGSRERLDELLKRAPPELHEKLRKNAEKATPFFWETTIYFGPQLGRDIPATEFEIPPERTPRTPAP